MLRRFERFLFFQTRNPAFLWGVVLITLAIGFVGAVVAAGLRSDGAGFDPTLPLALEDLPDIDEDGPFTRLLLATLTVTGDSDLPRLLDTIGRFSRHELVGDAEQIRTLLTDLPLTQPCREVGLTLLEAIIEGGAEPPATLLALGASDPPKPHAHYALGVYWSGRGELDAALAAFQLEANRPDGAAARRRLVETFVRLRDEPRLTEVVADPAYRDVLDNHTRLRIAVARHDWLDVFLRLIPLEIAALSQGSLLLGLLAGVMWLIFVVQASQPPRIASVSSGLCLLAVAAGLCSLVPTSFAIFWQEEVMGLVESDDLAGGLLFYLAGVGLREELAKLLLFLPFVPVLLRRGNEMEMLAVAGCVGLGFAAGENMGYFHHFGAIAAPGRFLIANFLHIALTGLCGLALCRAFLYAHRGGVSNFVIVFIGAVVLHALYDAMIALPDLQGIWIGSTICYILLCWQFFHEMRHLRRARRDTVSLPATFLFGASLVFAVTMVHVAHDIGLQPAMEILMPTAAELGVTAYVILRELPGTMVTV